MKTVFLSSIAFFVCFCSSAQIPVLYYDFENNFNRTAGENTPDQTINAGSSNLVRSFSAQEPNLTYTTGAGLLYNGAAAGLAYSSNRWPSGDPGVSATGFYGFHTSTLGFSGLSISFDAMANHSGMSVGVSWSTDNQTFQAASTSPLSLPTSFTNFQFVLPTGAENRSIIYIKIYAYGASNNGSTLTIDNLMLRAGTISASKTLLNYAALGLSMTSGTAFDPSYNNLIISGTGVTAILGSRLKIQGTLSVTNSATFSFANDGTMAGTGFFTVADGCTLQVSSASVLGAIKGNLGNQKLTLASNSTVEFTGAAQQHLEAFSLPNVTISNTHGKLLSGDVTINGTLNLKSGSLSAGTKKLTLKGSIVRTNGSLETGSGEIILNGSSAQNLPAGIFPAGVNHLTVDNAAGVTTAADIAITSALHLLSGTLFIGTSTLIIQGNMIQTAGLIDASSGTLVFGGSAAQTLPVDILTGNIRNLTVSNTAGVTATGNLSVNGTLTLTAGSLTITSNTLTIGGTINRTAGLIAAAEGTVIFSGTAAQTIPSSALSAFVKNLMVNNAAGVIINDDYTITSLLLLQTGSLDLNGKTVTISGTVSGNGTFRGSSASGLSIASSGAAGTLNFDQTTDGTSNALASFEVYSGSATLGGKLNIYTALNVAGGALDLAAKNLVLKSLPSNTARVAPVTGSITNASNVTVERWFPNNGRRWRMITPGVTTTTSIRENWMEGGMNTAFCATCNVNPNPGYGTQITGSGGTANGFDATPSNSASLYLYNQQTSGWTPVTSTSGNLSASTPYLIFLRGDRSVDMTANNNTQLLLPGSSTVLRAKGSIQIGTTTVSSLAGAGKTSFVSNPFPSPVSWASIYANNSGNFENYYTYWDPKIGQRGAYVTVTNTGLKNNTTSSATEQIQSGQGFFVTTKAGVSSPSLVIREQDKSTTSNINVFRFAKAPQKVEKLYASLNFTVSTGEKFNADGILMAFGSQFSNSIDADDAVQLANWDEDIAIAREGKALSIETRNALQDNDTIQLSIARLKTGVNYEWRFTPIELAGFTRTGYLVDKFLKKETQINLGNTTAIPFAITSDAASYMVDRFMVVFKAASTTLPVHFVSVSARQNANGHIEVEWQTANETNLALYEVQKSLDGQAFDKVAAITPKGGSTNSYSLTDGTVAEGKNIYRVKSIDRDGATGYSTVVLVSNQKQKKGLAVYPNPLHGKSLNLQIDNLARGTYTLQVKNCAGVIVFAKQLRWEEVNGQPVQLPETLAAGWYLITLAGQNKEEQSVVIKK